MTGEAQSKSVLMSPLVFGGVLVAAIIGAILFSPKTKTTQPGPGTNAGSKTGSQPSLKPYQRRLESARLASDAGHNDEALAELREAHKLAPDEAETNAALGVFYTRQQQFRLAEPYLARAKQLAPKNAVVRERYADALAKLGKVKEAYQEASEALILSPSNTELVFKVGVYALNSFNEKEAITHFQLLLKMDPKHSQGLRTLAHAYRLSGDPANQAQSLKRYLALKADDKEALESYLGACLNAGQGPELIKEFRERADKQPSLLNKRLLARALSSFPASFADGRKVLREAMEAQPDNADLRIEAAGLAGLQGDYRTAHDLLVPILEQKDCPPQAVMVAASQMRAQGKLKEALALFARLKDKDPLRFLLGTLLILRDQQDYDQALAKLQGLQSKVPPQARPSLLALQGEIALEAGRVKEAIKHYDEAIGLKPQDSLKARVLIDRARAYIVLKQAEVALKSLEHSIEFDKKQLWSNERRLVQAIALFQAGEEDKAKAVLTQLAADKRQHRPYVIESAAARFILGSVTEKDFDAVAKTHPKGRLFENDRLFLKAWRAKWQGQEKAMNDWLKKAREATLGNEWPGPLLPK